MVSGTLFREHSKSKTPPARVVFFDRLACERNRFAEFCIWSSEDHAVAGVLIDGVTRGVVSFGRPVSARGGWVVWHGRNVFRHETRSNVVGSCGSTTGHGSGGSWKRTGRTGEVSIIFRHVRANARHERVEVRIAGGVTSDGKLTTWVKSGNDNTNQNGDESHHDEHFQKCEPLSVLLETHV